MFVAEKDDGAQLLLNLSKFPFSCRFISSDTDRAEFNDVASKQWSKGEFDVLISTTIALVGNKNPLCRHVAVAGYKENAVWLQSRNQIPVVAFNSFTNFI